MAEAKKSHKKITTAIIVIVAAVGILVAYLWHKNKQQASAAASSTGTSSAVVPSAQPLNPVEQPNSYASTPVLQNYVSNSTVTNVSSQPVITHFGAKHWLPPLHPPTSPHMTPRGRGHH
jgi:flagellar basal body-associated protein FliL